jgi:hypothetical protein
MKRNNNVQENSLDKIWVAAITRGRLLLSEASLLTPGGGGGGWKEQIINEAIQTENGGQEEPQ